MKKIFLIVAVAIMAIVVYNCKKDSAVNKTALNNNSKMFMPEESQVIGIIKKFGNDCKSYKEAVQAKTLISIEDRPLEEGLWTLEATLNYDYRNPHDSMGNYTTDTLLITVNNAGTENGQAILNGNSMAEQYDVMNNFVAQQLANEPNSVLVAADLEVKESNATTTTFEVTTTRGLVVPDCGWRTDEHWGAVGGTCAGYVSPYYGIDGAPERIAMVINWNGGQVLSCSAGSIFYTNVVTVGEGYYPDTNPYRNYFWHNDFNECLGYTALLNWYNNAQYVKTQLIPYAGARCYHVDMAWYYVYYFGDHYYHRIAYKYGTAYCVMNN